MARTDAARLGRTAPFPVPADGGWHRRGACVALLASSTRLTVVQPSLRFFGTGIPHRCRADTVLSHLPNIEVDRHDQGVGLRAQTRHTLEEYDHYIVKHIVFDEDFGFVAEHMFHPLKDQEPVSRFALPGAERL
jgi:hypothetical protein